ncbi:MAG: toll/interleukin-1 receptor domain-containing protein [Bacillota bacterium]|nr:toll/interleukin-1 receptor domain-containing protein [Bacillota bacterium]
MKHKVFISYSSKDKQTADILVETLEQEGFPCWIAPRNIPAGTVWAKAITDAIQASKYFVLLFNRNSNASEQVVREVNLAIKYCEILLPLKIDESEPQNALEYYLSTAQWANTELLPIEKAAEQLCVRLRAVEDSDGREQEQAAAGLAPRKQAVLSPSERKSLESRAAAGDAEAQYEMGVASIYGGEKKDVPKGVHFLDLAAKQNHPQAQLALARVYMDKENGIQQDQKVISQLLRAASSTLPEAMMLLGKCCKTNRDRAFRCYFEAAMAGLPEAMYLTGLCLERGTGREKNISAALTWYEKAANRGHEAAMFSAGMLNYLNENKVQAAYWYGRGAEAGNSKAMDALARMYLYGNGGLPCDRKRAEELFRQAAALEYVPSMRALYKLLAESRPAEAAAFALAAAGQGDAWGQVTAGFALKDGSGINPDLKRAAEYFRRAAEQGDKRGQYMYGLMLLQGKGVRQDVETGASWLVKAAEQGLAAAQLALGGPFAGEIGDTRLSRKWLLRAAAQEEAEAYFYLASYYSSGSDYAKVKRILKQGAVMPKAPAVAALWLQRYKEEGKLSESLGVKGVGAAINVETSDWKEANWMSELWQAMPVCFSVGDYRSVRLCAERLLTYDVLKEKYRGSYRICKSIVDHEDVDTLDQVVQCIDGKLKLIPASGGAPAGPAEAHGDAGQ